MAPIIGMQQWDTMTRAELSSMWALDPRIYHLNHGSFGGVPKAGIDKQLQLKEDMESHPVQWFATLPEKVAVARVQMAARLGIDPECLAFVNSASAGASVVYHCLDIPKGSTVVTTSHGYGAVSMGAKRAATRAGANFVTVPIPLGASDAEIVQALMPYMTPSTSLLVIDQVTSASARSFPVATICEYARKAQVKTLVDGAHAPGVIDKPLAGVDADFWVGNLHKFACSPRGCAVLYAKKEHHKTLFPLVDSWGTLLPFPQRFDHLSTVDATPFLTAPFVWDWIENTFGWSNLHERSRKLLDEGEAIILDAFADRGWHQAKTDVGSPVGPMRLFGLPTTLGSNLELIDTYRLRLLASTPFEVSFTLFDSNPYLRLSAHAYNQIDDFEAFTKDGVDTILSWTQTMT
ncbi:MAG: aminotransferase class V-fold PLP-dependent enzyme [Actinomycetaceae bacterium]|nr:aminotransferase class V-fold PLP-dependent enzyme [Actinomycetaceae bacterium]